MSVSLKYELIDWCGHRWKCGKRFYVLACYEGMLILTDGKWVLSNVPVTYVVRRRK